MLVPAFEKGNNGRHENTKGTGTILHNRYDDLGAWIGIWRSNDEK